jgi:hypothetical protein
MAGNNVGAFVPTTNIWDIPELNKVDPNSRELFVRLYQNLNLIATNINIRDAGLYYTSEFVNGQQFFPNPAYTSLSAVTPEVRQVIRLVINFGALPNAATKSVAHGITITSSYTFTRIYATASDTTGLTYLPIPYASAVANNVIELSVDAVNVNITTGINRTNYNVCYVILEYLTQ